MDANEGKLIRICAWSMVAFLVLFGVGWGVLGRNIPPYSPDYSADHIAQIFRDHRDTMRIGYALGAFSCTFYLTWTLGLFRIMLRMEQGGKLLSYAQLLGGVLTVPVPMFACIIWLAASYRPETDPNITRALVDLGWMTIDIGFGVTIVQYVAFGIVVLRDDRERPLFPKWLAWLGIWVGVEFVVELVMPYFKSGPFSYNGIFAYWVPFFAPFAWLAGTVYYMIPATRRLEQETVSGPVAAAPVATPEPVPA